MTSNQRIASEPADRFTVEHYHAAVEAYYADSVRPQVDGTVGKVVPEWGVDLAAGKFLYDLGCRLRPAITIEIGLCQGASALHLAAAHAVNGNGVHFAIDPFQHDYFGNQGLLTIERFGLQRWFRHLAERSDRSLSMLHMGGLRADLVFIDGDHRFDAVFNDYYWADKLLTIGGNLIFDEAGYHFPTNRVANFIATNMPNYVRVESPARFYVFQKMADDGRDFSDEHEF